MILLYLEHFSVWHFLLCILDDAYHFELVIALVDPRCIFKSMGRSFDTSVCPSVPHYSSLNVFGFFSCKLKIEKDNLYAVSPNVIFTYPIFKSIGRSFDTFVCPHYSSLKVFEVKFRVDVGNSSYSTGQKMAIE